MFITNFSFLPVLQLYSLKTLSLSKLLTVEWSDEQGVEENIWTKEGWSDGRVEKNA
jgi:hypothetical protein